MSQEMLNLRALPHLPRLAATVLFAASLLFIAPTEASAQAPCKTDAAVAFDMVGHYSSPDVGLTVDIYPCGGAFVEAYWNWGWHPLAYASQERLVGGGIATAGISPSPYDGGYIDNTPYLLLKPAEPGYIQAITLDPYWRPIRVYRLRKLS